MSLLWIAVITIVILQISVFNTTIYLHRCVTHRGVELHPVIGFLMHLELLMFTGIVPREWAAVHRKHHHHSDEEGDPHSPRVFGMWKVLFANYFMYKKEANNQATINKYTPDYEPDALDRLPRVIQHYGVFFGLAVFMAMFGWEWGIAAWVFHIAGYIFLNSSINALGHMVGYRNFENLATNLQFLALLTGGEGLHNNHHAHPTAAKFALREREIDLAWPVIAILEKLHLARVNRLSLAKAAA